MEEFDLYISETGRLIIPKYNINYLFSPNEVVFHQCQKL